MGTANLMFLSISLMRSKSSNLQSLKRGPTKIPPIMSMNVNGLCSFSQWKIVSVNHEN